MLPARLYVRGVGEYAIEIVSGALAIEHSVAVLDVAHPAAEGGTIAFLPFGPKCAHAAQATPAIPAATAKMQGWTLHVTEDDERGRVGVRGRHGRESSLGTAPSMRHGPEEIIHGLLPRSDQLCEHFRACKQQSRRCWSSQILAKGDIVTRAAPSAQSFFRPHLRSFARNRSFRVYPSTKSRGPQVIKLIDEAASLQLQVELRSTRNT
jgi:hypothetical protein